MMEAACISVTDCTVQYFCKGEFHLIN